MKQTYTKLSIYVEPTDRHTTSTNVATCDECNSRGLKATHKERITIKGEPIFCPDCGSALFWERLWKERGKHK